MNLQNAPGVDEVDGFSEKILLCLSYPLVSGVVIEGGINLSSLLLAVCVVGGEGGLFGGDFVFTLSSLELDPAAGMKNDLLVKTVD